MECPFPGMDPYIERPAIWADFHDRFITCISAVLQPNLRPKYAAVVQDRLYVVESDCPIWPDVSVIKPPASRRKNGAAPAASVIDEPVTYEVPAEMRIPYIKIVSTTGNRLITAIEVLSPDNKVGDGRRQYLKKRKELKGARVNLVEIDLLRSGRSLFRIPASISESLPRWHYMVAVTRGRNRHEIYAAALEKRLPRVGVPLTSEDQDVALDLQASFQRCWQEGPYPELLRYDGPPPGTMTAVELAWCEERLKLAGLRR